MTNEIWDIITKICNNQTAEKCAALAGDIIQSFTNTDAMPLVVAEIDNDTLETLHDACNQELMARGYELD